MLVQLLRDRDAEVRRVAVDMLKIIARRGDRDVTPELLRLCVNDPDKDVRDAAMAALKGIGPGRKTGCEVPK
jgi:HEAT repeat protein